MTRFRFVYVVPRLGFPQRYPLFGLILREGGEVQIVRAAETPPDAEAAAALVESVLLARRFFWTLPLSMNQMATLSPIAELPPSADPEVFVKRMLNPLETP